ncbi:hypothetical protein [Flagellimonas meridianipacifica]|uniref:Tellurite resistance protein TerB n=1 Tax=Flagellimonas meridianipacifica TaxID=1080225 RepID=A0A2T0MI66_9FLAO|nr:hypothetical protein [Allomuricauda pacifica]PRX57239.1 hypothetical protein CLV81_1242 [Allomuricauda pacifica]
MMVTNKNIGKTFYQSLGKLFYAVAKADHSVHIKEIDRLKEMVREHWLEVDEVEDEYGTDAAFQIETVFDWLLENEKDAVECYEDFERFYTDHKARFNDQIKYLIMATARSIASAFSGRNKSELIALGRLELLFKT